MKDEIREAVAFLKQFIAKYGQLDQSQIDIIANMLTVALEERFVNHWYEDMPLKGQAFRCLRLKRSESYIDPDLEKILRQTGLKLNQLGLPNDFTLWIDPGEVSVRFGEQNGLGFTIARLNRGAGESSPVPSNPYERRGSPSSQSPENSNRIAAGYNKPVRPAAVALKKQNVSPKSSLIVENAEKMFDEKLTAFIRQNSSSTNTANTATTDSQQSDDLKCSVLISDSVVDDSLQQQQHQSSLSAEKRTISPPLSSSYLQNSLLNKRPNSSNISIVEQPTDATVNAKMMMMKAAKVDRSSLHNMPSRLSYNDSCYYSSSSSSCASSYESNKSGDHMILPAAWSNNNNNNSNNRPQQQQLSSSFNDKLLLAAETSLLSHHQFNSELNHQSQALINPMMSLSPQVLKTTTAPDSQLESSSKLTSLAAFNNGGGLDGFGKGLYGLDFDDNPFSHLSAPYSSATLFSDASSDRSDTPSSSITTASTASYLMGPSTSPSLSTAAFYDPAMMRRTNENPFSNNRPASSLSNGIIGSKILGANNNMSNFESSSSSAASTMTVSNENDKHMLFKGDEENREPTASAVAAAVNEDDLKNLGVEKELLAITGESESKKTAVEEGKKAKKTGGKKKKSAEKKEKKEAKSSTLATSPSSEKKSPAPVAASPTQSAGGDKKEDTYCGYVESFPYYYKLNRLYNALAVQKMQTDRMKKSSTGNLVGSPTSSASPTPFPVPGGLRHPAAAGSSGMLKSGAAPGTSPAASQYQNQRFMMVSPSPSPNPHSMAMATSPKQQALPPMSGSKNSNLANSSSFMNHAQQQAQAMYAANTMTGHLKPNGGGGQAYPMSPANAALSFANHQQTPRHATSNHQRNNSSAGMPNNLSLAHQLLSSQFSNLSTNANNTNNNFTSSSWNPMNAAAAANNNTFGLNIDSLFSGNSNSLSSLDTTATGGYPSSHPFAAAAQAQSPQQQMNMNMFGNWMLRGQSDMLRTNN